MKTLLTFGLSCLFFVLFSHAFAAVLTVDNTPGNNAMYSSFSDAQTAANPEDTLLVHASSVSYGNISVSKSLTIIGYGHGSAPLNEQRTRCSTLKITADNVSVSGFYISNNYSPYNLPYVSSTYNYIDGSDIRITGCLVRQPFAIHDSSVNIIFDGCVLGHNSFGEVLGVESATSSNGSTYPVNQTTAQNITYLNNVIITRSIYSSSSWLFMRNIIVTEGDAALFQCQNMSFTDNIFYITTAAAWNPENCLGCDFTDNLTYSGEGVLTDLANSTLNNTVPTWSLNGDAAYFFDFESDYHMLSGTPSTGASDGGEVGIYGGDYSFRKNGAPIGIPRVTSVSILNPTLYAGEELQIQFEAEGDSN